MLEDDGRVVLMDFGTGRMTSDDPGVPLAGTPLYLAPELFAGSAPSVASDIYSVGVLLYYLLTRSYPVRARDANDLRLAHERGERTPIADARPDLPRRLARVIDRATDADPARRPPSAESLARELTAVARPRLTKGIRATAAAAGLIALGVLVWEIHGRLIGDASRSRRIVAGLGDRLAERRARDRRRADADHRRASVRQPDRRARAPFCSTASPTRSCGTWRASMGSRCGPDTRRRRSVDRTVTCAPSASSCERTSSSPEPCCAPATRCA